jgi:hypothetical protein
VLYGFLLFPDEPKPVLSARSLLGHNGNQLDTLFHIELVLLDRLAIKTIGNFKYDLRSLVPVIDSALTGGGGSPQTGFVFPVGLGLAVVRADCYLKCEHRSKASLIATF